MFELSEILFFVIFWVLFTACFFAIVLFFLKKKTYGFL